MSYATATEVPQRPVKKKERKPGAGQRWLLGTAMTLIIIIMAAAMTFSFTAITDTAAWTGNNDGVLFLAAIFIDGAIITYTLSYAVFRYNGHKAVRTLVFMYSFTAISVAINFAHTADFWDWTFEVPRAYFGILIAVIAPIASMFAAEEVVRFAFVKKFPSTVKQDQGTQEPVIEQETLTIATPGTSVPTLAVEPEFVVPADPYGYDFIIPESIPEPMELARTAALMNEVLPYGR